MVCARCVANGFGPEGAKELSWIGTLQQLTVLHLDCKCSMNVGICSCGCMEAVVCGIGCARIPGVDMCIGCCSGYIYAVVYDAVACVCICECGVCECVFVVHMCGDVNC